MVVLCSTITPEGTTTFSSSSSSSEQSTYEFVRALTYPEEQNGWQQLSYEHHSSHHEYATYPDSDPDGFAADRIAQVRNDSPGPSGRQR